MSTKYVDLFVEYLQKDCGYPRCALRSNTYKYNGKEYGRVEVLFKENIIQAFVLMNEEHCHSLDKFPFYRTYTQWNDRGKLVPPACNVAVFQPKSKEWAIHSSSDLRYEITSSDFLNYKSAVARFQKRLQFIGNEKLRKTMSRLSILTLSFVLLYVTALFLSINGVLPGVTIPMNAEMVSIIILVVLLILLPSLIPYLRIKYNGLSLEISPDAMYY